jgi:RNA polymerase sigma-70 factor (ECF subfamily)
MPKRLQRADQRRSPPAPPREFIADFTGAQRRLHGFIRTLVPDPIVVDEILQETNLAVWEQAERFEPGSNFVAWACRIAWFKVLDHRRRVQRQRLRFSDTLMESLADEYLEDVDLAERQRTALANCMAALSDRQRTVLTMHYFKQMSLEQIGLSIDRKANAVGQMIFRIRKTLRDCIVRQMAGPEATS